MEAHLHVALTLLAGPRAGYLASWEAKRVGVSSRSLVEARRAGLLVPVRRGVGRLAAAPVHPMEPVHAATLAIPTAVATRASALALRAGLPTLDAPRPQVVTVGHLAARCSGIEAHVTRRLDGQDVTVLGGTPTETFGRAVLSVIGDRRVHWTWVARVLDAACRLWDDRALDAVQGAVDRAGARGHSGAADLRILVDERRRDGPRDRYALQRKVMAYLDAAGLHGHDEHHVVVEGRDRWIDRAFIESRVAVEVKGWSVHGGRQALDDDADREEALVAAGWCVFPVTSRTDPIRLVDRLRHAIQSRTARSLLPIEVPDSCQKWALQVAVGQAGSRSAS